jgi:adenylate cyclase
MSSATCSSSVFFSSTQSVLTLIVVEVFLMAKKRMSGRQAYEDFGKTFRSIYKPSAFTLLEKAAARTEDAIQATSAAQLGHPEYLHLKPGETREATAVVSFIDIRGFTKLSFVLDPQELLRIVQGLTQASINVIVDGGGYIGEFTGDGVMAYFGDSSMTGQDAAVAALETTSVLFKTVQEIVNPELENDGIDPIRIAAGMEFGKVLWARIGDGGTSQIKPISTATFLAGKLSSSKHADPWECKIGAELAKWTPEEYKTKSKQYGPYSVKGQDVSRDLYLLDWKKLASDCLINQDQLENKVRSRALLFSGTLSGAKVVAPSAPGSTTGPRPLKDQTFFGE